MQYLSPVTATEKYSSLPNKLGIFEISSDQLFQHSFRYGPIAVIYFLAKSCIHAVWPPENDQNVLYLSLNSAATGKFRGWAPNSVCRRKLWSLVNTIMPVVSTYYIVTIYRCGVYVTVFTIDSIYHITPLYHRESAEACFCFSNLNYLAAVNVMK